MFEGENLRFINFKNFKKIKAKTTKETNGMIICPLSFPGEIVATINTNNVDMATTTKKKLISVFSFIFYEL